MRISEEHLTEVIRKYCRTGPTGMSYVFMALQNVELMTNNGVKTLLDQIVEIYNNGQNEDNVKPKKKKPKS